MRDDIYRLAPLPPAFKQVVKACQNDADWRVEGRRKAEEAILKTIKAELRPELIAAVRETLVGVQQSLDPLDHLRRIRTDQVETPTEHLFMDHVIREITQSQHAPVQGAVLATLEEIGNRWEEPLDAYLATGWPKYRSEMMMRFRSSLRDIVSPDLARRVDEGKFGIKAVVSRKQLRPEDDIENLQ